ncbi:ABC transporter permease [bacterium]|nr:ABC transporter permease [bacterium]
MAIKFLFEEAFRSLFRSKRLNMISLGAMSMSLMALGLVLVLNVGIMELADFVEDKIEIVLFLTEDAKTDEISMLVTKIQDHPQVIAVYYISKQEALEEFSQDAALQDLIKVLGNNPLPSSLRIQLMEKTPENVKRFISWLKNLPGVSEVTYGGGDADRLLKALQFVRLAVLILTASLVLAAMVIIANIISLMVYAREAEIDIMRMIGATNGFIRGPFLIWGVIQGAVGGILATVLLYVIWYLLRYYSMHELGIDLNALLPPASRDQALTGAGLIILAGCFFGFVGSLVSVGRQLNE